MESFGIKIRKLRKDRRLTLEQLSSKCGIDRTYISKIESGKIRNPYLPTLEKLATALLVDVEVLYPFNTPSKNASMKEALQKDGFKIADDAEMVSILNSLQGLRQSDNRSYDHIKKVIQDLLSCFKAAA